MDVEIRHSRIHGKGVFATRDFKAGELITKTAAIVVPRSEVPTDHTLWTYVFGGENDKWILGLGAVSFVNHSKEPNAEVIHHVSAEELWLTATRPIRKDEEIYIKYTEVRFTPK